MDSNKVASFLEDQILLRGGEIDNGEGIDNDVDSIVQSLGAE